jgi:hypothetical protein
VFVAAARGDGVMTMPAAVERAVGLEAAPPPVVAVAADDAGVGSSSPPQAASSELALTLATPSAATRIRLRRVMRVPVNCATTRSVSFTCPPLHPICAIIWRTLSAADGTPMRESAARTLTYVYVAYI